MFINCTTFKGRLRIRTTIEAAVAPVTFNDKFLEFTNEKSKPSSSVMHSVLIEATFSHKDRYLRPAS
eukprot:m.1663746 g.1663746  ORF g.1663746 m.1663746 type:complete len:67 (-) comp137385_c0_seq1:88-288(-)